MQIRDNKEVHDYIKLASHHLKEYFKSLNPYHIMMLIDIFEYIKQYCDYDSNLDLDQRAALLRFYVKYMNFGPKEQLEFAEKEKAIDDFEAEGKVYWKLNGGRN